MSNAHIRRIQGHLTPMFLASEVQELIKSLPKYPANEKFVAFMNVGQFNELCGTSFHGSKKMLAELCACYVGRYMHFYRIKFGITDPFLNMNLLESTNETEKIAVDILFDRYKKERGDVPADVVAKIDSVVEDAWRKAGEAIHAMSESRNHTKQ